MIAPELCPLRRSRSSERRRREERAKVRRDHALRRQLRVEHLVEVVVGDPQDGVGLRELDVAVLGHEAGDALAMKRPVWIGTADFA